VLQNKTAIRNGVGHVIRACSYHFVIAMWRAKEAQFAHENKHPLFGFYSHPRLLCAFGTNNIYVGNEGSRGHESGSIHIGTTGTHRVTFIAGVLIAGGTGSQTALSSAELFIYRRRP
jgi:hypothetical protein